jgi:CRP/FNR family transcriptional regulator, cyclic AMP receptor protein
MTAMPAFFDRAFGEEPPVRLVDEDPDLFAGLPRKGQLEARARAIAPVIRLERGSWPAEVPELTDHNSCLGLLVLDGLLVHSIVVVHEPRSEIVGPGDVLRPWQHETEIASVPFASDWQVVHTARLAVLDNRFLAFAARWPTLLSAIVERTVRRSHWLALQLAITDLRRVDDRLMLFFWHLADRWGRMGPDGVVVPLPVTHDVLAQLVCAQRPTVTSALKRLTDGGLIRRRRDKTWLLAPDPPPVPAGVLAQLEATAAAR